MVDFSNAVNAVDEAAGFDAAADSAGATEAHCVVDDALAGSSVSFFAMHCGHIVVSLSSVFPQGTWRNPLQAPQ